VENKRRGRIVEDLGPFDGFEEDFGVKQRTNMVLWEEREFFEVFWEVFVKETGLYLFELICL